MSTDPRQAALAAEHAAVYVYAALAAQTDPVADAALRTRLSDAYGTHRGRRDLLTRDLADAGETPVAAAPAYDLPERLGDPAVVRRCALGVEEACAETYGWLVAHTTAATRRWAVAALVDAARRALVFGGVPQDLPGRPA
ncbi:MAG: DUF4439 domain-containing protein [Nocardioides sp.]